MAKPTFKISVGNSKKENSSGISKSSEGSPLVGGMEAGNGSNALFDKDGNVFIEATKNLFIKGKTLFQELEKADIVISDQYTLDALNVALSAIESIFVKTKDFQINTENFTVKADTSSSILAPQVLLGEVNTDILHAQPDGEQHTTEEELYNDLSQHDVVMVKKYFVLWWDIFMKPVLNEYAEFKNKFRTHTHNGFAPPLTEAETVTTNKENKAKSASNMLASKTTKVL